MSLVGELTYFLGLQVNKMEDNMFVSQSKYANNIVNKFGLDHASHKRTPVSTYLKLSRYENGVHVDQSLYISMIGSCLYLTARRPHITFDVCVCVGYQAKPKASHLAKVKRILKCISWTYDYVILYSHDTNPIIVGYYYAYWVGSVDDRKSISWGCFFLCNNLISWFSEKQNCVSLSTIETKYITVGSSCMQLI